MRSEPKLQRAVLLGAVVLLVGGGLRHWFYKAPLPECGPYAPPEQTALQQEMELPAPPGFAILGTDVYSAEALVLSTRKYASGVESELSPVDFALAWGPLTTRAALDAISYSQSWRWYEYRWKDLSAAGVTPSDIVRNSANVHILIPPGDESLRESAVLVRRGDTVRLSGYLVRVTNPAGWRWNSSRVRNDSGGGSCELLYLQKLAISSPES